VAKNAAPSSSQQQLEVLVGPLGQHERAECWQPNIMRITVRPPARVTSPVDRALRAGMDVILWGGRHEIRRGKLMMTAPLSSLIRCSVEGII
jgi:hypothetical protein